VPEHWAIKQLRNFAEIRRGKFTHRPRNDPAFYDGPYPFIQTGDITAAGQYITEYKQTLNEKGASVSQEFPSGTLVMTIAANIADVAILDFSAYFPDSVVGLIPSSSVDLMYLYYLMGSMKQPLSRVATVSTQLNLNTDQISGVPAACPPVLEQQKIVTFLDNTTSKIDTLIAKAQQAIALQKEHRTALISAVVTGKIDVRNEINVRKAA
jgi:type I restriction enzyme S subunit